MSSKNIRCADISMIAKTQSANKCQIETSKYKTFEYNKIKIPSANPDPNKIPVSIQQQIFQM